MAFIDFARLKPALIKRPTKTADEIVSLVVERSVQHHAQVPSGWTPGIRLGRSNDANWDMTCGPYPISFYDAFSDAVDEVQKLFDVDPVTVR